MNNTEAVKVLRWALASLLSCARGADDCTSGQSSEMKMVIADAESTLAATESIEQAEPVIAANKHLSDLQIYKLWCDSPDTGHVDDDVMVFAYALLRLTGSASQPAKPDALVPEWITNGLPETKGSNQFDTSDRCIVLVEQRFPDKPVSAFARYSPIGSLGWMIEGFQGDWKVLGWSPIPAATSTDKP